MDINLETLNAYSDIMVFPHKNPDGDALGSAVAISLMLKKMDKNTQIVIDDEVSPELRFLLMYDEFIDLEEAKEIVDDVNLAIIVDSGDLGRLERRRCLIENKDIWNIDHHITNPLYGKYNNVNPKAASTCEIIFTLFEEWGLELDRDIAEALYTGVSTDTGNFMYSNTTTDTFNIAGKLLSYNIRKDKIIGQLYQNKRRQKVELFSSILLNVKYEFDDTLAYAVINEEILKEHGCDMNDTDGLVENLRSISGVRLAVLFKEKFNEKVGKLQTKVSMRSTEGVDVSEIAAHFGGGGHKRASGFEMNEKNEIVIGKVIRYVSEENIL